MCPFDFSETYKSTGKNIVGISVISLSNIGICRQKEKYMDGMISLINRLKNYYSYMPGCSEHYNYKYRTDVVDTCWQPSVSSGHLPDYYSDMHCNDNAISFSKRPTPNRLKMFKQLYIELQNRVNNTEEEMRIQRRILTLRLQSSCMPIRNQLRLRYHTGVHTFQAPHNHRHRK